MVMLAVGQISAALALASAAVHSSPPMVKGG
jgi:hypothetical protein